ncbi:MAG: glycosyltransferase family 4 protein [Pseudomonadota bacterium]
MSGELALAPLYNDRLPISIAILTQQVSNYHAARYRAAAQRFQRVTVLSAMNDADFPEFLAIGRGDAEIIDLCAGKAAYLKAVANGRIKSMTAEALAAAAPDVVAVAGWAFPESLAAIAWAHQQRVPVVMMSASQHRDGARSPFREFVKSRVVRACQSALVGGREQGHYVSLLGMPDNRIFQGYDAVDNEHFWEVAERARANADTLRRSLGLPEWYLLASARFIAKKNLPRLVYAFGKAREQVGTEHGLVILGDGPERATVETAIRNARLESHVHLPGFQPYDRLPVYYGLAEAFVHVSLAEQWGLVVNEAAAAGLPMVVSSACGAASELVEDSANGFLVDPTDTAAISAALAKLILLSHEARTAMGARSRQIVAGWGPHRFADGLVRAASAAMAVPARSPAVWDRVLLRVLSRRTISAVA